MKPSILALGLVIAACGGSESHTTCVAPNPALDVSATPGPGEELVLVQVLRGQEAFEISCAFEPCTTWRIYGPAGEYQVSAWVSDASDGHIVSASVVVADEPNSSCGPRTAHIRLTLDGIERE